MEIEKERNMEEMRRLSPEKMGRVSPEREKMRLLSPEEEEMMRRLSPEMKEMLRLCQERYFNLARRYLDFLPRIQSCKDKLHEREEALERIMEEKKLVTISWEEISSCCNQLKMDFSTYTLDRKNCLECNLNDISSLRKISRQNNHQSEVAKLMRAEIRNIHKKCLNLCMFLSEAEDEEERLSSTNKVLEEKYNQYLVEISEEEKHKQLSHPTERKLLSSL